MVLEPLCHVCSNLDTLLSSIPFSHLNYAIYESTDSAVEVEGVNRATILH